MKILRKKTQSGFTLMEILIAVAVLAIGVVAVVNLFPVGLQAARRTANFSDVAVLAQKAMGFYSGEGYGYIEDLYDNPGAYGGGSDIINGERFSYIPDIAAGADIEEWGGGMEGAEPFEDNPDYRWRIVISDVVPHESDVNGTPTEFHDNAEIYSITLYIYWLDRGQEQFDEFTTLIAKYE